MENDNEHLSIYVKTNNLCELFRMQTIDLNMILNMILKKMVLNFSVNSNQIKTHKQNSDRHFSSHAQLLMCLASNENKMSC